MKPLVRLSYWEVGYHVVVDNGEPGTADRLGISLSNGYMLTTRTLAGGNIQLQTKPFYDRTSNVHLVRINCA